MVGRRLSFWVSALLVTGRVSGSVSSAQKSSPSTDHFGAVFPLNIQPRKLYSKTTFTWPPKKKTPIRSMYLATFNYHLATCRQVYHTWIVWEGENLPSIIFLCSWVGISKAKTTMRLWLVVSTHSSKKN